MEENLNKYKEKINDIKIIQTFIGESIIVENFKQYEITPYRILDLESSVVKSLKEMNHDIFKRLLSNLNTNRRFKNEKLIDVTFEDFKKMSNFDEIAKFSVAENEKRLEIWRNEQNKLKIKNRIRKEKISNEFNSLLEIRMNLVKYLNNTFPNELNDLKFLENKKQIKTIYNSLLKKIKESIERNNSQFDSLFNHNKIKYISLDRKKDIEIINVFKKKRITLEDLHLNSIYILKLRLEVINALKNIESFTPYKEIIAEIIDIKPGYHHYASNIYKNFVDEWDIYYSDKPSIDLAINKILNHKIYNKQTVLPSEYIFLFKKKNLTSFGFDHLYDVLDKLKILIDEKNSIEKSSMLEKYSNKYGLNSKYIERENYCLYANEAEGKIFWKFNEMILFQKEVNDLIRQAENLVREEMNLPKVNEGWISEVKLYNQINDHFINRKVIHHARLSFLGKQHLDIFIPSLKTALEYQGLQHDEPVDFFGGIEAFIKNQERDRRKLDLCIKNGIRIIYVREKYVLKDVIKEIESI